MLFNQFEPLADARQHSEPEHIDFEHAHRIDVVFVPFDHRAIFHRRVFDRNKFAQQPPRHHKPAHVLRKVSRKPDEFANELHESPHRFITRIEAEFFQLRRDITRIGIGERVLFPAIHAFGDAIDGIQRKPQHLTHVAHGAAPTIGDHRRRQTRAVASVLAIDVLNDFFAPFVFKIDIDVGRFIALDTDEPFEQNVDAIRIHRRHAQAETNRRIRRSPTPLTENPARSRECHDVMNGQKVPGVFKLFDQRKLVFDLFAHLLGHAIRIAMVRTFPGQLP